MQNHSVKFKNNHGLGTDARSKTQDTRHVSHGVNRFRRFWGGLGGPPEADKCFGGYDTKKYLIFFGRRGLRVYNRAISGKYSRDRRHRRNVGLLRLFREVLPRGYRCAINVNNFFERRGK